MLSPPFKPKLSPLACCDEPQDPPAQVQAAAPGRTRLADIDAHLHCSIIGTCMSTAELRKLMARFEDVEGWSELEIHHEGVLKTTQRGDFAKLVNKALDQRHAVALRRFAKAHDEAALAGAWDEAGRQGEIPGAYWALLSHAKLTPALRQRAFGEVHMLSHLVGASNGAQIRRLVASEKENAELVERLEREQQRRQELVAEREALGAELQQARLAEHPQPGERSAALQQAMPDPILLAQHTLRREHAEQAAAAARAEAARLQEELEHLRQYTQTLSQELAAAEMQLRASASPEGEGKPDSALQLQGRRILYVGGRPSSITAIRDLVQRQGGDFQHHDGGLEDRKGLLAAAVPKADLVVFPVDCVDHDSALNLKRLGERYGVRWLALRSASVASFIAALRAPAADVSPQLAAGESPRFCLKHG